MNEIKKIKAGQKEVFYSGYYQTDKIELSEPVEDSVSGLFSFPDIDYNDKSRSAWDSEKHYKRIQMLISADEKLIENESRRERILGALRYWVENDFINPNWWYNQIGVPMCMADIAIALEDYLTDDLKKGLDRIISRGSFRPNCVYGLGEIADLKATERYLTADQWTGANLIWGATITIKHALWTEDEKLLKIALDRLADEICYDDEGIQPDGAFCQHGPRWYSGGYGRSFVYEIAPILFIIQGTSYDLPKEKVDIILSHILDGQRAMHKNGYFDFGAVGREYTRPGKINAGILIPAVKLLSMTDGISKRAELQEFYKEISGGEDEHEVTRFYKSICQLCHKKNGMYIGVRGRSEGIFGAEKCNDEGNLSYNMSYGTVTCVMKNGKEYFDISPFWDYSKIPGTTTVYETDEELLAREGWESNIETDCCAYGKATDSAGALTEKVRHDGISLTTSFFVFDGAMVAMGTDIKDESIRKRSLYTTVDQCRASEPVIEDNFVRNGDVCYKNLDSSCDFVAVAEKKQGSWSRNNYEASKELLSDAILTVTMPVAEHNSYAYAVFGENEPQVSVIRNDKECQAILIDNDKVMAVFHHDTSFCINDKAVCGKAGEILFV